MLLINGKPVDDNFFNRLAEFEKTEVSEFTLKRPTSFKLQNSFFTIKRQKEMKSGRTITRELCSPEFSIDATYDWFNPFIGAQCKLTYTQQYMPDEQGRNRNPISQVSFEYGYLTIPQEDTYLYFWLNNHPLNQTNPKYLNKENTRPPKPFLFREILPDLESALAVDNEQLVAQVTLRLTDSSYKGYINDEALKQLAKSYGFGSVLNKGRKDLVKHLMPYVKQNPNKILDDINSAATEIRAVLSDAIQYNVVKFDMPYVKWIEIKGKRALNNGIIVQCPNGMEPLDYFVNWMREKDNSNVYQQIKKELEDKKLAEVEASALAS